MATQKEMPNRNYITGAYYEYKCVKALKKAGALVAQRSAGSHSPVDIWGVMRDGSTLMIQVKTGGANTRVEEFRQLPCCYPNRKQLWYYHNKKLEIEDIP